MNPEAAILRAQLLIQQNRHAAAQELLGSALAADPDNGQAHALMALCLAQNRDTLRDATREAQQAIHLDPDEAFPFYVLAIIQDQRNLRQESEEAIDQAIAIDPGNAELHGVHAYLQTRKKNHWQQALESAERGLAIDPEHEQCGAIRSLALERLGRLDDAVADARRAIRNSPDSADAHASEGWALLQQGDYKKSQESFREALRLEPSNEFARQGMMQSLNASNIIFRGFHRMLMWISRLDTRVQTFLFLGFWVVVNILNRMAADNPALAPWIMPISIFYLLFVMMAWIINPLFNTFLRFHKFGKHLLSNREKWASNCVAAALVFAIVAGIVVAYKNDEVIIGVLALLHGIYLTIPISVAFRAEAKWAKWVSAIVAIAFTLLYIVNVWSWYNGLLSVVLVQSFTFGILIYCFVGGAIANAEDRV